jgi:G3E family GTPase
LGEIERAIRTINSSAQLLRTSFSSVDPLWVLDINSYSLRDLQSIRLPESLIPPPPEHNHDHVHQDGECSCATLPTSPSRHTANTLSTHGFSFEGKLNLNSLKILLDRLLYSFEGTPEIHSIPSLPTILPLKRPSETAEIAPSKSTPSHGHIYRMKGVFHIENESNLFIMQAVHDVFDIQASTFLTGSKEDETNGMNRVIMIGKDIDSIYIENEIRKCLISF